MEKQAKPRWNIVAAVVAFLACSGPSFGQSFSSGSTGADSALNLTGDGTTTVTVRAGGIYHYTTVNVGAGHTLRFVRGGDNSPVVILATGDVTIAGTIDVRGQNGPPPSSPPFSTGPRNGARGGPGGFTGGNGGVFQSLNPTPGQGPGGGAPSSGGGAAGGTYAASSSFVTLTPLFGGSGGGGGGGGLNLQLGGGGAGGGGAILIASSTRISITGVITANGGDPGQDINAGCHNKAGAGSGGAIRLVAPEIVGAGHLRAQRGTPEVSNSSCFPTMAPPSDGRIRLEAFAPIGFAGSTLPIASVATVPGPVSPAGNPALLNVPTLVITSIGGVAVPAERGASYFVPDITLAPGTANPVSVQLAATNTPVGSPTEITVRLMRMGTAATHFAVPAANHTGSFASSTAVVDVTLPVGQVSVLQAFATMTLTGQTASLFPLIDGEQVERLMVSATPGKPSTLSLVTRSGREVPLDNLAAEDRTRVALAWESIR